MSRGKRLNKLNRLWNNINLFNISLKSEIWKNTGEKKYEQWPKSLQI